MSVITKGHWRDDEGMRNDTKTTQKREKRDISA